MTIVPASSSPLVPSELKHVDPIIDTDVHETLSSLEDLLPYLAAPWRGLIEQKEWLPPTAPFARWTGHGLNRADAFPASGAPPGSSYDLLREQVLDVYPIKYAILTGWFMPGSMEMQFEFRLGSGISL